MSVLIKANQQGTTGVIADYNGAFTSSVANSTATQIVAPAANVNGVIVLRMVVHGIAGTARAYINLLAKTSAPANVNDGDILASLAIDLNSQPIPKNTEDIYIKVPAGKGLYFMGTTNDTTAKSLTYKIL